MKIVEFCEVHDNGEDGRGHTTVVARFATRQEAEKAFHGNLYVSFHDVVITIFQSKEDYKENNDKTLREKALAKLTTHEKKLLGLPLR